MSTNPNSPTPASQLGAMSDRKPLVAILAGGFSAEAEISRQSGQEVWESLQNSDFEAVLVTVQPGRWIAGPDQIPVDLSDFSLQWQGEKRRFDAVFVALHGRPGENGELAGYLEMMDIPHTTCDVRAAVLTFDKALCKQKVADTGVKLAKAKLLKNGQTPDLEQDSSLRFPLFVKPNRNGSSCGISKVNNPKELETALTEGWKYDDELLVEEGVEGGTEVTCAVYRLDHELHTLPLCEIVSGKGHDFFDYKAKYTAGEADEIIPARIPDDLALKVRTCSEAIYRQLDLSGLVRIDYILLDQQVWFLEVNTVPGMSQASIVPKMVRATGQTTGQFFSILLQDCLDRHAQKHQASYG
jgi:D-alanine-D-alanine ligase